MCLTNGRFCGYYWNDSSYYGCNGIRRLGTMGSDLAWFLCIAFRFRIFRWSFKKKLNWRKRWILISVLVFFFVASVFLLCFIYSGYISHRTYKKRDLSDLSKIIIYKNCLCLGDYDTIYGTLCKRKSYSTKIMLIMIMNPFIVQSKNW